MKKIIFLCFGFVILTTACTKAPVQENLSIEEAKAKALSFINSSLMQEGQEVSVKEVVEDSGMYKVVVNMPNGQEIESFISKDGKKFFPQVMDIEETEKKVAEATAGETAETGGQAPEAVEAPKTDVAKAELFVMSFCPYGVVAEKAMAPVFDLLGDKADIKIRFIASVSGDDINKVSSLHGPIEGIEDARQLCVEKNYGKEVLWKYVAEINEKCYPIYRNGDDVYKTCWQTAANNAGVDTAKIDSCIENEGVELINAEDAAAQGYGVTGSPSLVINGTKVNVARTPEGYKTAICNAFVTPPAECSQVLSDEGAAASGDCN